MCARAAPHLSTQRDARVNKHNHTMPTTDLLKTFGLSRNPFTDRTAEKTCHDATSLYIHSDLRGFTPHDTTYVIFGRRGRCGGRVCAVSLCDADRRNCPVALHTAPSPDNAVGVRADGGC